MDNGHARLGQRRVLATGRSLIGHRQSQLRSGFRLRFAQAGDAVARFPIAAFFEQLNALVALENVAFGTQVGRGAEAGVL